MLVKKAKSHQLPYSKLSSTSSYRLELVYSYVWGLAPDSGWTKRYYVSFINHYSKFTWIYLLGFTFSSLYQKCLKNFMSSNRINLCRNLKLLLEIIEVVHKSRIM
jgi:hypothetical protein